MGNGPFETCEKNGWEPYIVQIHPSYSYEEFVEGLKPVTFPTGDLRYDVVDGPVKVLANKIGKKSVSILCAISMSEKHLIVRLPLGVSERYELKQVYLTEGSMKSDRYFDVQADSIIIPLAEVPEWSRALVDSVEQLKREADLSEVFQKICFLNHGSSDKQFCLILDEINRGNVSQLLGELMFSIAETDSENPKAVNLQYSQQPFRWPPGLHVIGTMNTADLSTDRMDHAVKRRFTFEYVEPRIGLFGLDETKFAFLKEFNEAMLVRDANFAKVASLDELLLRFAKSQRSFSQLLDSANKLLLREKKYGIVNAADKLIGHSYLIKLARRICKSPEGPIVLEHACMGEFKEMLLGELLPAIQSIFNYDTESMSAFFADWTMQTIEAPIGSEAWADEVMIGLFWGSNAAAKKPVSLESYRQGLWKPKSA